MASDKQQFFLLSNLSSKNGYFDSVDIVIFPSGQANILHFCRKLLLYRKNSMTDRLIRFFAFVNTPLQLPISTI